ncbi:MAG TPA: hypothetical protein VGO93_27220 [Candidatus Xenobia bacterium]
MRRTLYALGLAFCLAGAPAVWSAPLQGGGPAIVSSAAPVQAYDGFIPPRGPVGIRPAATPLPPGYQEAAVELNRHGVALPEIDARTALLPGALLLGMLALVAERSEAEP